MPRILFLTELLPYPLVAGPKTRAYYVLRHLAERHQVTLVSFVRPDDRPEYVAHLSSFLDQVYTVPMQRSWARNLRAGVVSLLTGRPAIIAREEIGAMRRILGHLISQDGFDVIHADQLPMAQYGLLGQGAKIKRVLDQHNATYQIVGRLAQYEENSLKRTLLQHEARSFLRYELDVMQRFDFVTFVTQDDKRALLRQMKYQRSIDDKTAVIPICVDTQAVQRVTPVSAPFRVTHIGTMFWPPNVEGVLWFVEQVWPRVRAAAPEAMLTLIGKNPPEHVRTLGRQAGVEVLGYVEDLTPYLTETAAFIVPLHAAGGMRVKIVDSWCWGLPVVSTTVGAEGIDTRHGENLLIADTPAGFADAVLALLQNAEFRRTIGHNGRAWVEKHYDWHQVYPLWDDVYAQLTRG